jgi:hypothetical protein
MAALPIPLPVLLGTVLLVLGPPAAYLSYGLRDRNAALTATPVTAVRNLADPGPVAVHGTAYPVGDGIESPFAGESGIATTWRVRDWDDQDRGRWLTEVEGAVVAPFDLDDGTGTVRVDPGEDWERRRSATQGGDLGLSAGSYGVTIDGRTLETPPPETVAEVGVDEAPPERAAAFAGRTDLVPGQSGSVTNAVNVGHKHGDRRYEETTIPAGVELYVYGDLQPRDGEAPARLRPETAVVGPGEGDPALVLSTRHPPDPSGRRGGQRPSCSASARRRQPSVSSRSWAESPSERGRRRSCVPPLLYPR